MDVSNTAIAQMPYQDLASTQESRETALTLSGTDLSQKMETKGFEPLTHSKKHRENKGLSKQAAQNAAHLVSKTQITAPIHPPDLAQRIEAWPTLPQILRDSILAMVAK